jgi:hypothetical protein
MDAKVTQTAITAGAALTIRAYLSEYGVPVDHRAAVHALIERPDGTQTATTLTEIDEGVFETQHTTTVEGVYRIRVLANGVTLRGQPFTRERLATGAVVSGGDQPPRTSDPAAPGGSNDLCDLLDCLLDHGVLDSFLTEHKIDRDGVKRCIKHVCDQSGRPTDTELREREGTATTEHRAATPPDLSAAIIERVTRLLDDRLSSIVSEESDITTHFDKEY